LIFTVHYCWKPIREPKYVEEIVGIKLACLSRADYFTCAGTKQLYYYLAWLLAGLDLHEFPLCHHSPPPPDLPNHSYWPEEPVFVYGGIFRGRIRHWDLQLTEEIETAGRGEIRFLAASILMTLPSERFEKLRKQLMGSRYVRFYPPTPRDKLINEYTGASVAWDVMARNPEMSWPLPLVQSNIYGGLPVVYQLRRTANYIAEYDAGWIVDPADEAQIRQVARDPEQSSASTP